MWVGVNIDINVFIFVYMISLYSFHIGNMRNNKEPTGNEYFHCKSKTRDPLKNISEKTLRAPEYYTETLWV